MRSTAIALLLVLKHTPVVSLVARSISSSPFDLLAADQYAAQSRRAEFERCLLLRGDGLIAEELMEPDYKLGASIGGGFGGGTKKWSKSKAIALKQKQCLADDGVLRINGALTLKACVSLREHVLEQVDKTASLYEAYKQGHAPTFSAEYYYGIEPGRPFRTDLLLSLTAPPVQEALQELFHIKSGKLRNLYEHLVSKDGILYEMASVVTSKGSHRQCFHPDVPYQAIAPLYVVFVALQDVTPAMGPTAFIRGGNTEAANRAFMNKGDELDSFLQKANAVESCLKAGDLVVFDARVLHCGNANLDVDRALFNFSFRNPLVTGDIGYKGSMRPEYTRQGITFGDVLSGVDTRNSLPSSRL